MVGGTDRRSVASGPVTSPAITLRPERPDDHEVIDRVVGAAFLAELGSTSEVGLVRALRDRGELVPELTLVAVAGDAVVGHIAFSPVTIDGAPSRGLGLAPVAVDPAWQGRGVGSALVEAGLRGAVARGDELVVLLGHADYYPRFGFVPAAPLGLVGDYGEGPTWMVHPLGRTSVPRGHVRYPSAFQE